MLCGHGRGIFSQVERSGLETYTHELLHLLSLQALLELSLFARGKSGGLSSQPSVMMAVVVPWEHEKFAQITYPSMIVAE